MDKNYCDVPAQCRFCSKPLTLKVDAEYQRLGDPHKLLGLAACNRCADFIVERNTVTTSIRVVCVELVSKRGMWSSEYEQVVREALFKRVNRYMRLLASHNGYDAPELDPAIVDRMIHRPAHYAVHLKLVRDAVPQMEMKL